jgi:hypothetical protein
MSQHMIERIKRLTKYHLVLRFIFNKLRYAGIHIIPYYLTQERLNREIKPNVNPELGTVTVSLLSPPEMEAVYAYLESKGLAVSRATLAKQSCECFVLKIKDEIVASSWFKLHCCHDRLLSFPLKKDEAYLCNAATLNSYRGKSLAPFLRYEAYKYLEQIGRTKFYSITEYFNTPALKFKEKLGAKQLKLGLCIRFLNRWKWNITLRIFRT